MNWSKTMLLASAAALAFAAALGTGAKHAEEDRLRHQLRHA